MKIAQINMTTEGSTGKIMMQIGKRAREKGIDVTTFSTNRFSYQYKKLPKRTENHDYFGTFFENTIHYYLGRIFGYNGCYSVFGTIRLVKKLEKIGIDVLHLHNLHGYCINLPILFRYIKKNNVTVVWTLHDCWPFTGHCPHFELIECYRWKKGCHHCPKHERYPASMFDDSKWMYILKKKWFTSINEMLIVTPSSWLAKYVKQSFLQKFQVKVIPNGIDLNVFKPTKGDFRKNHCCENKYIILGVAFDWGYGKGLDVFVELAKCLDDTCQIVLVGTNEEIDKTLPENIISIHKTNNQEELAQIYTTVDLFVNASREDNFPTVIMEALACGTPVLSFDTGGSSEMIDNKCGKIVKCGDIQALLAEILNIKNGDGFSSRECVEKAKTFDKDELFDKYIDLYNQLR